MRMISVLLVCLSMLAQPASAQLQLRSADATKALRDIIPEVDDEDIQAKLSDPRLIFFTDGDVFNAFQVWNGQYNGVFDARLDISGGADRFGFGNARQEFPWKFPFGTDMSPHGAQAGGIGSFRALWLPLDGKNVQVPVAVWRERLKMPREIRIAANTPSGFRWLYPTGAHVFEFVTIRSPQGYDLVWSIRVRKKTLEDWEVDIFVPFHTPTQLVEQIKTVYRLWEQDEDVKLAMQTILSGEQLEWGRGYRNRHVRNILTAHTAMEYLPSFGQYHDGLVHALLTRTKFSSALGNQWRQIENKPAGFNNPAQPTTRELFHVVPRLYQGGYVQYTKESCLRCHSTANMSVHFFDSVDREWYGRVTGSDTILSIHPFDQQAISRNGQNIEPRLRGDFVANRVFIPLERARQPASWYRIVNARE